MSFRTGASPATIVRVGPQTRVRFRCEYAPTFRAAGRATPAAGRHRGTEWSEPTRSLDTVDWQPFETHTIVDELPAGMLAYSTYHLTPTQEGTQLTIIVGPVHDKNRLKRTIGNRVMTYMWRKMGPSGLRALRQRIEQDLAEGKTMKPEAAEVDKADIRDAARTALLAVVES